MKLFYKFIGLLILIAYLEQTKCDTEYSITPPQETDQPVINPDQGFYKPLTVVIDPKKVVYDTTDPDAIYHLRCDISVFSKENNGEADIELTKEALDGIDDLLSKIREKGKNAIIRFTYDPNYAGNADKECGMDMIKTHIKQLSGVLNKYPDVLTAIEAGMIGRWGEMHSSKIVTADNAQAVIDTWLDNTNKIPILVRYPYFLYYFCDKKTQIDEVEGITFGPGDKGYWLGMYNDGMYGDNTDLGTWKQDRDKEMTWISLQTAHLPYGGECEIRDDVEVIYIKKSIPEMFMNHISYLNIFYNVEIHNKWKQETYDDSIAGHKIFNGKTGYEFIYAHFGYRLVMSEIKVSTSDSNKVYIKIKVQNNGFGFVNKVKKIGLAYSYDNSSVIKEDNELGEYYGKQDDIDISGKLVDNPSDDYSVYLRLYYRIEDGDVKYPIKFANSDNYNENIKGNFLFKVSKDGKVYSP